MHLARGDRKPEHDATPATASSTSARLAQPATLPARMDTERDQRQQRHHREQKNGLKYGGPDREGT